MGKKMCDMCMIGRERKEVSIEDGLTTRGASL